MALAAVAQSLSSAALAQVDVDTPPSAGPAVGTGTPASGLSIPSAVGAAVGRWRFGSSIGLGENYSDNINLSPAGSERSEFVTSISPSLQLSRYSARFTTNISYAPQLLFYANGTGSTQVRNGLSAAANGTIIENFLFFDAQASISQTNVSPFGTLADNTVNNSANRAESRTYSLGPSLRSHLGSDLSYSAGYHFTSSSSDNSAYAANHTSQLYAQFASGTSLRDLGYGLDVSRSEQGFGTQSIVQETAGLTLTYVVAPTFHLRGRIGADLDSYPTAGRPDTKSLSYSGGFDWQPSRHTSLSAQFGHRYFGPTANVSLSETTSKVAVSASFNRDQTTSSGNGLGLVANPAYTLLDQSFQATITDPALRAQAVAATLQQAGYSTSQFAQSTFLSSQLYVSKVAQVTVALLGLHNTVTFGASRSESQGLSNITTGFDVFNTTSRFRSTTMNANWSRPLGPRTTASMTASRTHNQAVSGNGNTTAYQVSASLSRQFQRRFSGSVTIRHSQQTAEGGGAGVATAASTTPVASGSANNTANRNYYGGNYSENAVIGSLSLSF